MAERARARARIQAARAERDTRERAGAERESTRLLARAWPRLGEALMRRWQDTVGRGLWVRDALAQAREVLPADRWLVRHAPDWSEAERQSVLAELRAEGDRIPELHLDRDIRAGVVVQSARAVLDATIDGILSDRPRLEARLLALLGEDLGP